MSLLGREYRANSCSFKIEPFHWTPLSAMPQSLLMAKVGMQQAIFLSVICSFLLLQQLGVALRFAMEEGFEHLGWYDATGLRGLGAWARDLWQLGAFLPGHTSECGQLQCSAGLLGYVRLSARFSSLTSTHFSQVHALKVPRGVKLFHSCDACPASVLQMSAAILMLAAQKYLAAHSIRSSSGTKGPLLLSQVIRASAKSSRWLLAIQLLGGMEKDELRESKSSSRGVPELVLFQFQERCLPDLITFSGAVCEDTPWPHALGVLQQMEQLLVAPNAVTWLGLQLITGFPWSLISSSQLRGLAALLPQCWQQMSGKWRVSYLYTWQLLYLGGIKRWKYCQYCTFSD